MKKNIFLVCAWMILISAILSGCSSPAVGLLSSEGIFSYNRHTGQIELLWENKAKSPVIIHDTIFVDSCNRVNIY